MDPAERRTHDRKQDFRVFRDINLQTAHYTAGAEIISRGAVSPVMYIIHKGIVAVRVDGAVVAQLGEGEIFGEMGLVDPRPHLATVGAVSDVELYVVDESQFLALIAKTPMFALRVMRVLAGRLRAMNSRLLESRQMTG